MLSCYITSTELANQNLLAYGCNYTQARHCQVAYLYYVKELGRAAIAKITGYAASTLSGMWKKVAALIEKAKTIFADLSGEIVQQTAEKTLFCKRGGADVEIQLAAECGEDIKGTQQVYLFKFYSAKELLFSKIGTSARSVIARLREEIAAYRKSGFDVCKVEVCKIVPCGDLPAESYESYLRAQLIKEYPKMWKRNDRFFGVDLPTKRFTALCTEFAKL